METTLLFLKPDSVQRGLIGPILSRFEAKGLQFVGIKLMAVPRELAEKHYAEHEGKPFYEGLLNFVTSSPVLVLAVRGVNAIAVCRNLIGATNGQKADAGTIRGDYGMSAGNNLIHGSDSPESAERELALWFKPDELTDYEPNAAKWVYDPQDLG
ncbi:MAG: nucleoside-diphosphate kinase [Planctomycetota bacterium]